MHSICDIGMFAGLGESAQGVLESVARRETHEDGQVIAVEGSAEPPIFFVLEGSVRAYKTSAEGRQQTLTRLGPGSAFYIPPAFSEMRTAPATTEVVGQTTLMKISQDDFRRVTSETPELALLVLRDLSTKLQSFVGLTHDLGLLSVRGRLASFLLQRAGDGSEISPKLTHEEIASSIGTVREVVSRTLRTFVREGLLQPDRQRIVLLDRKGLEVESKL